MPRNERCLASLGRQFIMAGSARGLLPYLISGELGEYIFEYTAAMCLICVIAVARLYDTVRRLGL